MHTSWCDRVTRAHFRDSLRGESRDSGCDTSVKRGVAMSLQNLSLGRFGDRRLDKRGRRCSDEWSRVRACACGDWHAGGARRKSASDDFWAERLIEGWSAQTAVAVKGRHVLALQDTSEFNFSTTPKRRRGLGKIGKGGGRGVLLHAMLALDAGTGGCLGLVAGRIWTRRGRVKVAHQKRKTENKESHRWIVTAEQSKSVLAAATQVTVVADRESDIFAQWAKTPKPGFHLISRAMHDRRLATGEDLYAAAERFAFTAKRLPPLPGGGEKHTARAE